MTSEWNGAKIFDEMGEWHKASKASISSYGVEEKVCVKQTDITKMCLRNGYIQTSHKRDGCNHTSKWPQKQASTSPRRAKSMAKPRSIHANMDIKN